MTVTLVSAISNVTGYVTSGTADYTLATSASLQAGDILILNVRTVNFTVSAPTGWTLLTSTYGTSVADKVYIYQFMKDSVTSADASTTFTITGSVVNGSPLRYSVAAFRVPDRGGVYAASSTVVTNSAANQLVTLPAVTAVYGRELVVVSYAGSYGSISSFTTASGLTLATVTSGYESIHYQELTNGASTTSANHGWGWSISNSCGAAIVTRIQLQLTPQSLADAIGSSDASAVGWNLSTATADSVGLAPGALFGRTQEASLADALAFAYATGAIDPLFSLISLADGFNFTDEAAGGTSYPMINPINGRPIFREFREVTDLGYYIDAYDAFTQWATQLNQPVTNTASEFIYYNAGTFLELGFAPVVSSPATQIFLGGSGQINFFATRPGVGYQANDINLFYNGIGWSYAAWPLTFPLLSIGMRDTFDGLYYGNFREVSGFQLLRGVESATPVDVAAITFITRTRATDSASRDPIRISIRLKPNFMEVVVSPLAAYGHSAHLLQYAVGDPLLAELTTAYILASDFTTTRVYQSLDLSNLAVSVSDSLAIMGPSNSQIISKWTTTPTMADGVKLQDQQGVAYPRAAADAMRLTDPADWAIRYAGLITDTVRFLETTAFNGTFNVSAVDRVRLIDALTSAYPLSVAETVGVSDVLQTLAGVVVAESLGLLDAPIAKATLYRTFTELLRVSDELRRFFAGDITEAVRIAPTQAVKYNILRQLSETVGILPTLSKQLIFRVVANESIRVNDAELLKMIFSGQLAEDVQISAAYIQPGDAHTTWTVNTRTGATSEYGNFNFNSFGRVGHKYLGASSEGLFELQGDDDAGTPVVARLKSGYAQFNGSRFTGFKAAYLGVRADGEFVFKIDTGTGSSTVYNIVAQNMQTTKINIGKGIRARYIAFELISTGQDFDLDTVEFVPMPAQRRV